MSLFFTQDEAFDIRAALDNDFASGYRYLNELIMAKVTVSKTLYGHEKSWTWSESQSLKDTHQGILVCVEKIK